MSKSQAPLLTTTNETADGPANALSHQRQVIRRHVASWARWLHIYLSMASFAILFFFAVTGLTLNHAEYFSAEPRVAQFKGTIELNWVKGEDSAVDKLAVVERLRQAHGIRGALSDFRVDDAQASVSFKGPGYAADAFINRETGEYELTETRSGLVAVVNDLHKGRDSGRVWSWLIDASAVFMSLVSLSGLVLIWFVKRRRLSGLLLAVVCGIASYLIYVFLIP